MTKRELKELIKPLIRECVQEVIFQEGALSTIIKEVATGLGVNEERVLVAEAKQPVHTQETQQKEYSKKLKETRRKMMNAIGSDTYGGQNLFEGTEPLRAGGAPGGSPTPTSPLDGVDPRDPGVDITSLMPGMDKVWKKLM